MSANTERTLLAGLLLVCSVLLLPNLDNNYLWQDEAQTALISKTILEHGLPHGTDDKNDFSQLGGAEYGDDHLWKWHPWFPFYLLAGFFELFGAGTVSARLPFALLGIATVQLTFRLAKNCFGARVALLSAGLLTVSVPFLLLAQQCRYYSPAIFLTIAGLHEYIRVIGRRPAGKSLFVLSLLLLFHTQFLFCAVVSASVTIHALLFHRHRSKSVALLCTLVLLASLPFLLTVYGADYSRVDVGTSGLPKIASFLGTYFALLFRHAFSPLLLLIPPLVAAIRWRRQEAVLPRHRPLWTGLCLLLLTIFSGMLLMSHFSYMAFFRDLAPLLPLLVILAALLLDALLRIHAVAGAGVVLLLVLISPLRSYVYELTHDYHGPIEGIVNHLNKHADSGDVVAISYGDMPLKFYTGLRVIGGLTGEDLSEARAAEWVILRKHSVAHRARSVRDFVLENVDQSRYERIVIDYADTPFENREDPDSHRYKTDELEDRVVIYRRIR